MDVDGVAGAPAQFLLLMVLVFGKILVGDDFLFLVIFYMILVMDQGLSFGKTVGVGRHLLLLAILNCLNFAEIGRQVWLTL